MNKLIILATISFCVLAYATERGDAAPDFTLKNPEEKNAFTLSSHKGKKPVVLVFGSYT